MHIFKIYFLIYNLHDIFGSVYKNVHTLPLLWVIEMIFLGGILQ